MESNSRDKDGTWRNWTNLKIDLFDLAFGCFWFWHVQFTIHDKQISRGTDRLTTVRAWIQWRCWQTWPWHKLCIACNIHNLFAYNFTQTWLRVLKLWIFSTSPQAMCPWCKVEELDSEPADVFFHVRVWEVAHRSAIKTESGKRYSHSVTGKSSCFAKHFVNIIMLMMLTMLGSLMLITWVGMSWPRLTCTIQYWLLPLAVWPWTSMVLMNYMCIQASCRRLSLSQRISNQYARIGSSNRPWNRKGTMRHEWQTVRCECGEDARHLKGKCKGKRYEKMLERPNDYVRSIKKLNVIKWGRGPYGKRRTSEMNGTAHKQGCRPSKV